MPIQRPFSSFGQTSFPCPNTICFPTHTLPMMCTPLSPTLLMACAPPTLFTRPDPHKSRLRAMLETTYEGAVRMVEDPWLFVWHLHLLLTLAHFVIWMGTYGWIGGPGPDSIQVRLLCQVCCIACHCCWFAGAVVCMFCVLHFLVPVGTTKWRRVCCQGIYLPPTLPVPQPLPPTCADP